jgi:hypothetical protein
MSGNLEDTIVYDEEKGVMEVGGDDAPYAVIHNEPVGTYTLMKPNSGRFLVYYNYRSGEWNRKEYVLRPGIAFFDRAIEKNVPDLPDIVRDVAAEEFKEYK